MPSLKETILQHRPELQDTLLSVEQATSLQLMLQAAWRLLSCLVVVLVEDVLQARAQEPTQWPCCPQCGQRLQSKGFEHRQLTTLFGVIHWQRRLGRCPNRCPIGQVVPLDEALQVRPYQNTCSLLQEMACRLAVFVPFGTVALLLQQCFGRSPSAGSICNWVQSAGAVALKQVEEQLQQLQQGQLPTPETLDAAVAQLPLLIGGDGVMVPFRPHPGTPQGKTQWREVKVGILARLKQRLNASSQTVTTLLQRRVVAVLGNTAQLGSRLLWESLKQDVMHAPQVVWLSDGARGLWNLYRFQFSLYTLGILDFYHASQHLWKAAAACWDGRSSKARQWFEQARHDLRHGQGPQGLAELQQTLDSEALPEAAKNTLRQVLTYLQTHQDHIDYEHFKQLGLPLGSGFVESSCKWLIQQRFKGVGMRWSETGFNHLLHLRLAWVNGRFDAIFPKTASPNL